MSFANHSTLNSVVAETDNSSNLKAKWYRQDLSDPKVSKAYHAALLDLENLAEIEAATQALIGSSRNHATAAFAARLSAFQNRTSTLRSSGFGDLCFGGVSEEEDDFGQGLDPSLMSNNLRVFETGGFVRDGFFSLMRLPKKIREMIFVLTIGPFYNKKTNNIHIRLSNWSAPRYSRYQGFGQDQMTPFGIQVSHPYRTSPYVLLASPMKKRIGGKDEFGDQVDESMLDLVRNISHVSTVVRSEIGEAFFGRIELSWRDNLRHPDRRNCLSSLRAFISERSEACKSAPKRFEATLSLQDLALLPPQIGQSPFNEFFALVTTELKINKFHLRLSLYKSQLDDLVEEGGEVFKILLPVRAMKVQQKFEVSVEATMDESHTDLHSLPFLGRRNRQREFALDVEKKELLLPALLLPDSLREKSLTEMDLYLLARKQMTEEEKTRETKQDSTGESENDGGETKDLTGQNWDGD